MIDKLILEWIIPALKEQTTIKGDVPGHEFHGNQYADGSGGGGGESSSDGGGDSGGSFESIGSYDMTTADYSGKHQIIFKKDKKEVGEITIQKRSDGNYEVGNVLVWPQYQRSGHATQFYKEASKYAHSHKKKLFISNDRTEQAKKLHSSFQKRGILKTDGEIVFP